MSHSLQISTTKAWRKVLDNCFLSAIDFTISSNNYQREKQQMKIGRIVYKFGDSHFELTRQITYANKLRKQEK